MKKKLLIILLLLLLPVMVQAANYTLMWDANSEPDLAGYKLYWGTESGKYTNIKDVGNVTEYQISLDGTYYLAVTAYDTYGLESEYSNEVDTERSAPPTGLRFKPVARIIIEVPE